MPGCCGTFGTFHCLVGAKVAAVVRCVFVRLEPNVGQTMRRPFFPLIPIEPGTPFCLRAQRTEPKVELSRRPIGRAFSPGLSIPATALGCVQPTWRSAYLHHHRVAAPAAAAVPCEHRGSIGPLSAEPLVHSSALLSGPDAAPVRAVGGSEPLRHPGGKR